MAATKSSNPSLQPPNPLNSNTNNQDQINHGRRFLGVRQRPSGRWVAEIKVSSQKLRLWLGTFNRAEDAAMAYDRAARLLRGRSAKTNFPYDHNHGFFNSTINEEQARSLFGHSPKLSRLLQRAIMNNRSRLRSTGDSQYYHQRQQPSRNNGFIDSVVEDTIFCSSTNLVENNHNNNNNKGCGCGFSFGNSKVYTSVFVAPSFSSDVEK